MRGYLTVFLAMSLSVLTGFILLLAGGAIRNEEKVRLECALDTGMNAVLSEYHIGLFERYGLLYVDASYLGRAPAISNVEERLMFYLKENTEKTLEGEHTPWGNLHIEKVQIPCFETAAANRGASMRNQAVCYVEDVGMKEQEKEAFLHIEEIRALEDNDPITEWNDIMEQLAGIELPRILNEKGIWEEVPLSNPADWVFGLINSDILYLAGIEPQNINPAHVSLEDYISHRQIENINSDDQREKNDTELFASYLFHQMGCLKGVREGSLLTCQLEYLVQGKDSDLENVRGVAEKLMRWRFSDNLSRAISDGDLRAQAMDAAEKLQAVQLKEALRDPVAESILYACAFLESIGDIQSLYNGGRVPVRKTGHQMSVNQVLHGNFCATNSSSGLTYEQYLACMLLLTEDDILNLRAMDLMEMDIRYSDGNHNFAMDWCIERYEATVIAKSGFGINLSLRRKYGYF